MTASDHAPRVGPGNPYLADSSYPIAHGRCEAWVNTDVSSPNSVPYFRINR